MSRLEQYGGYPRTLESIPDTVRIVPIVKTPQLHRDHSLEVGIHGRNDLHGGFPVGRQVPVFIACRGQEGDRCRQAGSSGTEKGPLVVKVKAMVGPEFLEQLANGPAFRLGKGLGIAVQVHAIEIFPGIGLGPVGIEHGDDHQAATGHYPSCHGVSGMQKVDHIPNGLGGRGFVPVHLGPHQDLPFSPAHGEGVQGISLDRFPDFPQLDGMF